MPKDEKGCEVISKFVLPDDGYEAWEAGPIMEEDLAELRRMKELREKITVKNGKHPYYKEDFLRY